MSCSSIAKFVSSVNQACKKNSTYAVVDYNKTTFHLSKLMFRNGLLTHYSIRSMYTDNNLEPKLFIVLYFRTNQVTNSVRYIKQISKPGRRIYISKKDIFHLFSKYSFAILSTSMGFRTLNEARQLGIGGEFIIEIDC